MVEVFGIASSIVGVVGLAAKTVDYINLASKIVGTEQGIYGSLEEQSSSNIVLSFRPVQAERILALQRKLVELLKTRQELLATPTNGSPDKADVANFDPERINGEIDAYLHTYANALRDYETFSQEAVSGFTPTPSRVRLLYYLGFNRKKFTQLKSESRRREALLSQLDWENSGAYAFRELNRETRLEKERRNAFSERLWMGAFGGAALIGPMLLMTLRRDLNTSIITASVATSLFVLVLGIGGRELGGKDILAATAAYAAVLVVFVGTSMASTTS